MVEGQEGADREVRGGECERDGPQQWGSAEDIPEKVGSRQGGGPFLLQDWGKEDRTQVTWNNRKKGKKLKVLL